MADLRAAAVELRVVVVVVVGDLSVVEVVAGDLLVAVVVAGDLLVVVVVAGDLQAVVHPELLGDVEKKPILAAHEPAGLPSFEAETARGAYLALGLLGQCRVLLAELARGVHLAQSLFGQCHVQVVQHAGN